MKRKIIITSLILVLTSLSALYAQPVKEFLKVVAENKMGISERELDDQFGVSVSISGNYAIVGSYNDKDEKGATSIKDAGAAYIFERLTSSAPWLFKQKLVASDRAKGDAFGLVAISGEYAIVGASGEDHIVSGGAFEKDVGAAYIFEREGISPYEWKEVKKIVAPDGAAGDYFGGSVSISGDYIIVGAGWVGPREPNYGFGAGAAYIFERSPSGRPGGGIWNYTQKLQAFDKVAGDLFGYSVAISGSFAIVGAFLEDEDTTGGSGSLSNAGSAYIFDRNSSHPPGYMGAWSNIPKKIVAPGRASEDRFGYSVAISGSFAIVGAANEDMTVNDDWAGAAYIFERDALGNWNKGQKITSSTRANGEEFGIGVAIDGNYAIVGAYRSGNLNSGMAYVFERKIGPSIGQVGAWSFNSKIFSSDIADYDNFGRYVAISGCSALIGARFEEEDVLGGNTIVRAGSAYFFECEKPPTPKLCCDIPDVDITLNRVGKTDKFNLNINSANAAIQEVEVSMIDYHAEYESESCKPKDMGIFGNINSTTTNFGGLLLTDNKTHSPVWEAGSPSALNGSIGILISKPNLFDIRNCRNSKFYFCLKVKITDTDCNICEQIVCGSLELGPSQFPGGGVLKK